MREIDEKRKYAETQQYMKRVKEKILLYVSQTKTMPRPEHVSTGLSDSPTGEQFSSSLLYGTIPFKDIGVPPKDPYGNPLIYFLTRDLSNYPPKYVCGNIDIRKIYTGKVYDHEVIMVYSEDLNSDMSKRNRTSAFVIQSKGKNGQWDLLGIHNSRNQTYGIPILKASRKENFDDVVLTTSPAEIFKAGNCL